MRIFEVKLYQMKTMHQHNVSIHANFHQNRLINEYAKKIRPKINADFIYVRCRRIDVLDKIFK